MTLTATPTTDDTLVQTPEATEEPAIPDLPALPAETETLSIAEVADKLGVTAHTLRYYERIGLVDVPRDAAGRRRYRALDIARVVFIARLRMTDMPISLIQRYFELVADGPHTEPERLELLLQHRDEVQQRLDNLQVALATIEYKIGMYGGSMTATSCKP